MKQVFAFAFILFLSLCESGCRSEDSELKEQIRDLESENDDIEEDFYIAYNALTMIDNLLSSNNVDSIRIITQTALTDLGDDRFKIENNTAIDILTFRFVLLDTATTNFLREFRYRDYKEKKDAFFRRKNNEIKQLQ